MNLSGATSRLNIIVGENDQVYQRPLYEAIVFAAKKYKLSGATVCKGLLSYGAGSNAHSVKVFSLSEDAPMHIQLVEPEPEESLLWKRWKYCTTRHPPKPPC